MEGGRIETAFAFGLSLLVHLALLRQFAGIGFVPAMALPSPIKVVVVERPAALRVGSTTRLPDALNRRSVQPVARVAPPATRSTQSHRIRGSRAGRMRRGW